jgi:CRP-like cAMP-binding protein
MQNIVAIEDSNVLQLRKSDLETLFFKVPKFERFFRIIMQNSYIREQLRVLQNLSLSAEERYNIFTNKYPQLMPHISQKQIASYLGVTPEFLSTMRKNKMKKRIS